MFRVLTCLATEHDLRLVVLAGIVCFLASLSAISLFNRARATSGLARVAWVVGAGVATGFGIWSTHFIAMLAYDPGTLIAYDVALTAISLAVAVAITTGGLAAAAYGKSWRSAAFGGAIVGGGVASMHYLGMFAVQIPGHIGWASELVVVSIVLGIILGAAGLSLATRGDNTRTTLIAAATVTLAIVSHHFTAMGAVEITPDPTRAIEAFSLSPAALAIAIAGAAMSVLGISIVGALSDRRLAARTDQFARTEQKLIRDSEAALSAQNVKLDAALNNMSHGLLMFDRDSNLALCNERYIEMYGVSPDVVRPGCSFRALLEHRAAGGTFVGDIDRHIAEWQRAMAEGKPKNYVVEFPGGRTISITNRPMPGGGWVATHEDVTERRRAEMQIAHLAHHDPLTQLPNRIAFNERLQATLESAAETQKGFAMLCLDLDRFKEVNDVFGHAAGDELLREVATRLKGAAQGAFVARLGGDEFTLIVSDPNADAGALAERLQAALAEEISVGDHSVRSGVTIGIAIYPSDGTDANTLLANADAALYRGKSEGRGSVRYFEAEMDTRLRDRRLLLQELRLAVERHELRLFYQPQARIDGEVIGFEALLRWHHPTRGMVQPGLFIPVAEESGLIIQLGEWVLREACREAASWPNPLQIAVNLSPVQFQHGDLPKLIHEVLLATGLAAGRLELEITEGVLVGDFARAVSILRRLKALGVRIAMDDFGTGYSSLSYLQAFPFDKIKIDQTFVAKLKNNPQSEAIVRAVIGLGHGLNLPVVAEGVETHEQNAFLLREECDEIQGFLIGRPAPIADYAHYTGERAQRRAAAE
ncbi:MAG: EAL domain-containing protein [Alphaproteobacteria bacterium]|nr:EAL domain-containing protein [Alphaproteobacteria bacterium]